MKNLLNEKPNSKLIGRLKFTVKKFIKEKDVVNKKVLDIGCGYGWFELNALKRGVKEIHGIEITDEDLKTVRENIKDLRAKFKKGGALKLPFRDNYFDTVVSWEVIEHIPKNTEDRMFKEVSRVLKKNGIFYLSTP
jgi:ubiquinone/menaquinone biosynthesis C-methylase UbiE